MSNKHNRLARTVIAEALNSDDPDAEPMDLNEEVEIADATPAPIVTAPSISPEMQAFVAANAEMLRQVLQAQSAPATTTIIKADVQHPQNVDYNERSPFTYPEGNRVKPKPRLSRETLFLSSRQRDDDLTPLEIELFNRFTRGVREARGGKWRATVTSDGTNEVLKITSVEATSLDGKMSLPPLAVMLTELLDGEEAADPTRMLEELTALKRQVAALSQARA